MLTLTTHHIGKTHYVLIGASGSGKTTAFSNEINQLNRLPLSTEVYILDPKVTVLLQQSPSTYYTTNREEGLSKLRELIEQRTSVPNSRGQDSPEVFFYIDEIGEVLQHKEAKVLLKQAFQQPPSTGLWMRVSAQQENDLAFLWEQPIC